MTLIELLAGLVILGTVLSAMVVARGRLTRQWADADRKIEAGKALDAMLATWVELPGRRLPVPSSGALPGTNDCVWRSQWVGNLVAKKLGAAVVQVDVFDRRHQSTPIVTIELLMHIDPPRRSPPATTRAAGVR